ncbi:hypothetical protein BFJ71_g16936 [Fusarium oxysporum]|nr:hypothetical protein BFJ71_g16936 [Fusarium oxysporum]
MKNSTMAGNSENGAHFLQQLCAIGLLEPPEEQPASLAETLSLNTPTSDRALPVGELLPSQPKRRPFPISLKPQTQPSIFWKAFANSLIPLLSFSTSLADDDQAIFLTTPTQAGIPGGALAPEEIVYFQIFSKADALQILNCPGFSLDQGSYFSQLSTFMRCLVSDDDKPHIGEAREALLTATAAKEAAWRNALARYETILQDDTSFTAFQEFIK